MENKDSELWELAQKRAKFKHHLRVYIIMNIFFWLVWYFTGQKYSGGMRFPWPVWPMFGWASEYFLIIWAYINLQAN